jgi:hypothetical protein
VDTGAVRIMTTDETRAFLGRNTVAGELLLRVQPIDVAARADVAA